MGLAINPQQKKKPNINKNKKKINLQHKKINRMGTQFLKLQNNYHINQCFKNIMYR